MIYITEFYCISLLLLFNYIILWSKLCIKTDILYDSIIINYRPGV